MTIFHILWPARQFSAVRLRAPFVAGGLSHVVVGVLSSTAVALPAVWAAALALCMP